MQKQVKTARTNKFVHATKQTHQIDQKETFEKRTFSVISTKVGIHKDLKKLDSRFHGNDKIVYISTFYDFINL